MKKEIIIISIIALTLFGHGKALAQPDVLSASGDFNHGGSVTISGSGFGSKMPAAPFLWDNCETGVPTDKWTFVRPIAANNPSYNYAYRTGPFRNVSVPHTAGGNSKIGAGGHMDDYPDCQNVGMWKTGLGGTRFLLLMFYHRLDPLWPDKEDSHYFFDIGQGNPYYGPPYFSAGYCNYSGPRCYATGHNRGNCSMGTYCRPGNQECSSGPYSFTLDSIRTKWVHKELLMDNSSSGFVDILHDNEYKWDTETCDPADGGINYVGIGCFWRTTSVPRDTGHADAWKYFDDIYIDTTFSRVILGNHETYTSCTILEPQIPSAWSNNGNSITCTVNLGKLTDSGMAYLFVFDADNKHNPVGFTVEIGGSGGGGGEGPYTSGHSPGKSIRGFYRDSNIIVHILDSDEGVDQSSIVMTVNGQSVNPAISGGPSDYTLTYDPPAPLAGVVTVTLNAKDLANNAMSQETYTFSISNVTAE